MIKYPTSCSPVGNKITIHLPLCQRLNMNDLIELGWYRFQFVYLYLILDPVRYITNRS
jgi:hypothetical protein